MNYYDGLYILNLQGKDEDLKSAIDGLEKEIKAQGGKVLGSQKMDKRKFERVAGPIDSGFYTNIEFNLDPANLEPLKSKLKLNPLVYRQFYLRKQAPKPVAAAA
jgi:small subunit ribosomal protein S6